jgi:hypothetical protein
MMNVETFSYFVTTTNLPSNEFIIYANGVNPEFNNKRQGYYKYLSGVRHGVLNKLRFAKYHKQKKDEFIITFVYTDGAFGFTCQQKFVDSIKDAVKFLNKPEITTDMIQGMFDKINHERAEEICQIWHSEQMLVSIIYAPKKC